MEHYFDALIKIFFFYAVKLNQDMPALLFSKY